MTKLLGALISLVLIILAIVVAAVLLSCAFMSVVFMCYSIILGLSGSHGALWAAAEALLLFATLCWGISETMSIAFHAVSVIKRRTKGESFNA